MVLCLCPLCVGIIVLVLVLVSEVLVLEATVLETSLPSCPALFICYLSFLSLSRCGLCQTFTTWVKARSESC